MKKPVVNQILADRLSAARKDRGLSQIDLAKAVGMRQTAIGEIEAGRVARPKKLREIARAVGKSEEWLLGEAPSRELKRVPLDEVFPPDPDPDKVPTIGAHTGLDGIPPDASAQLDVTAGMGGGGMTIISPGVPGKSGMTFAAENVRDYWRLPIEILMALGLRAADICIMPVQGDSMAPTLTEGEYVFVDTRHRLPSPDGLYALTDDFGGIVVKRLEVVGRHDEDTLIKVISDNPRHPPKDRLLSEVNIIGRIVRRFGVVS